MKINFAMWKKASWELIKMDSKPEWDALDVISKWLIATRSAVTAVTVYSSIFAALLAWRDGYLTTTFNWVTWVIITLGLFIAHGTNNLLNDYTDFSRGVDKDNYFRTQYGVHPLVQGFWTKSQQLQWFLVSGFLATISGVYAMWYSHFDPYVIGLFVFGALVLLFYTWPMKYWSVGELAIFLIWGPILIGGVYLVLALAGNNASDVLGKTLQAALAGIPWGLTVASINIAKHTDKLIPDKAKGVGTFPVRAGETVARYTTIFTIIAAYVIVIYLVVIGYLAPVLLLVLFGLKRAAFAIAIINKPRPTEAPKGYEAFWPTYFSGVCFYHNRMFGGMLILGFLIDAALKVAFKATQPQLVNTISFAVLGVAIVYALYQEFLAKKTA